MCKGALSRVASMVHVSLLLMCGESGETYPRWRGGGPSSHTCALLSLLLGPETRQHTDPWFRIRMHMYSREQFFMIKFVKCDLSHTFLLLKDFKNKFFKAFLTFWAMLKKFVLVQKFLFENDPSEREFFFLCRVQKNPRISCGFKSVIYLGDKIILRNVKVK